MSVPSLSWQIIAFHLKTRWCVCAGGGGEGGFQPAPLGSSAGQPAWYKAVSKRIRSPAVPFTMACVSK
jgi:hypothetical protein